MNEALFQTLITPPFILGQFIVNFTWPAAVTFSAFIALGLGLILALNYGTKSPRWIFIPLLLAHLQVIIHSQLGMPAWWIVVILMVASIVWLVWKSRETLFAGLLMAWFCAVYGGATAIVLYARA